MASKKESKGMQILHEMYGQNPDWANLVSGIGGPMAGATFEAKAYPKVIQALKKLGELSKEGENIEGNPNVVGNMYRDLRRYKGILDKWAGSSNPTTQRLQKIPAAVRRPFAMQQGELSPSVLEIYKAEGRPLPKEYLTDDQENLFMHNRQITDILQRLGKHLKNR